MSAFKTEAFLSSRASTCSCGWVLANTTSYDFYLAMWAQRSNSQHYLISFFCVCNIMKHFKLSARSLCWTHDWQCEESSRFSAVSKAKLIHPSPAFSLPIHQCLTVSYNFWLFVRDPVCPVCVQVLRSAGETVRVTCALLDLRSISPWAFQPIRTTPYGCPGQLFPHHPPYLPSFKVFWHKQPRSSSVAYSIPILPLQSRAELWPDPQPAQRPLAHRL